jgi:lantibiotic modifying enzyme
VFPTIPEGHLSNTVCVAYGTAGVVHALGRAGWPLPDGLIDRLRCDALSTVEELGPGLYVGTAGIAHVLAGNGLLGEARDLLAHADRHPLTGESATLFGGASGVALTHLALYGHTRDEYHVDRAVALAASLPPDADLAGRLGPDDATGLMHGRCGVALMFAQLAGVTGERRHLTRAVRLLHAELDRAVDPDAPGLLFPMSATDSRAMPYLYSGSAGLVHAATRCLRIADDERLAAELPRLLAPLRLTYTALSGLFQGLSGYAFTLADHAAATDDETSRRAAVRVARGLFKYSVPHRTGVRFLGDKLMRYSAELWSGSAGVLLALAHVLDPRPDALFTVDALIDEKR